MTQKLKLSIIGDDYVHSAEMEVDSHIALNHETFQWLRSAFMGIGFNSATVDAFLTESKGGS